MENRFPKVEIVSSEMLWAWLEQHNLQEDSVWLVTWKAASPEKYVSREQVLDALVSYGWIDGRRMKLDDMRTMQLISPRKQQRWAASYQKRAVKLEAEGRMKAPGRAAITSAKASGLWDEMRHIDALEEPFDLSDALTEGSARAWWDQAAPSYRRNILRWIATAKKPETRAKRIKTAVAHAKDGKKVPQF